MLPMSFGRGQRPGWAQEGGGPVLEFTLGMSLGAISRFGFVRFSPSGWAVQWTQNLDNLGAAKIKKLVK